MAQRKKAKAGKPGKNDDKGNRNPFLSGNGPVYFIIAVMVVIAFLQSFRNDYVSFDDEQMVRNAEEVISDPYNIFIESIRRDAWAGKSNIFYRPVQTFFLLFLAELGSGFGIFSTFLLILHVINTLLVFRISFISGMKRDLSAVFAILFGVHPLFVPLVSWVPGIGDVLMTFFLLVAFLSFIRFAYSSKPIHLALHLTTFFLAVMSKETAMLFPLAILIWYFLPAGMTRDRVRMMRLLLPAAAGWMISAAVYLLLRQGFFNAHEISAQDAGIHFRHILANAAVIPELIMKWVLPVKLSLISAFSVPRIVPGLLLLLAAVVYSLYAGSGRSWLVFGMVWFLLFILPTLIFTHPDYDYLEHRSYVAFAGVFISLGALKYRRWVFHTLLVVIPVMWVLTILRTSHFKDSIVFFDHVVQNSGLAMAYNSRGTEKEIRKGDYQGALEDYDKAISMNPEYGDAYANRAKLRVTAFGDLKGALEDYDRAIDIYSRAGHIYRNRLDYSDIYSNRGAVRSKLNDPDGALADYNAAIEMNPELAEPYNNRGLIREIRMKDFQGALEDYSAAIRLNPSYSDAWHNRGMCYLGLGRLEEACADWNTAARQGHVNARKMIETKCLGSRIRGN
ncbi:MAG: tetratricopeptide repeat protein [Bacteroidales bacterium]|nr:tetratricopeptide repeat protein [Bacteroidales bacterium]